ncbi:MAG: histidine kinase [Bacteroidales bacterium]|nr:histidine kinase [Bacteroidales bacterium]
MKWSLRIIWRQILFSPFFLAIPVAIGVILFIPDFFPKYTAPLVESGIIDKPGGFEYYHDLDGDGGSERIILFNNTQNQASIKIIEEDGSIGNHYYFSGEIYERYEGLTIGEIDSCGNTVIFLFTIHHDTLLLHCVVPAGEYPDGFRNKFIAVLPGKDDTYDFQISSYGLVDLDGDNRKEFLAGIMAGFPLKPRIVVAYDFTNDTLIYTDDFGPLFYIHSIADVGDDGTKELFTCTYSVFNYPDSLAGPFDDRKALVLGFDHKLRPIFPPVPFPGKYILVMTLPIKTPTGEMNLVSLVNQLIDGDCYPRLILSDMAGKQLMERKLPNPDEKHNYSLFADITDPSKLLILDGKGGLEVVDASLKSIKSVQLDEKLAGLRRPVDMDGDGEMEYLGYRGLLNTPTIFRNDLSYPVDLKFPLSSVVWYVGIKEVNGAPPLSFLQQQDMYYLFAYGKNRWFLLKYPFYLGIYLAFLGIILLAQYLQRVVLRQRYDAEKKIAELQLLLLKNQLDPHFTFNTISTINSLIAQKQPDEANRMITQLSHLMRSCIDHTDKISRSLGEELNFVRDYISLEQTRMNNSFTFEITLEPETDLNFQVPKMIVQIYAENALKHGLRPKGEGGKLVIAVRSSQFSVLSSDPHDSHDPHDFHDSCLTPITISIEDNGVGRTAAARNGSTGTGKGMGIMEQYFEILNKYNQQKITSQITDLTDAAGEPCGTRVEIVLPEGVRYRFY